MPYANNLKIIERDNFDDLQILECEADTGHFVFTLLYLSFGRKMIPIKLGFYYTLLGKQKTII